MKNLSELKKYLALPKASLRMVSYEWLKNGEWISQPVKNPNYRGVAKLQTNAFALETPEARSGASWLHFGKASEWAFDTGSNLIVNLSGATRITYAYANLTIVGEGVPNE